MTLKEINNKRFLKNRNYFLGENIMQKYICESCGYIYDPAIGDEEGGIEAGVSFENLPEDWCCPDCGVSKEDFEPNDG